jgi:hypothetical protein
MIKVAAYGKVSRDGIGIMLKTILPTCCRFPTTLGTNIASLLLIRDAFRDVQIPAEYIGARGVVVAAAGKPEKALVVFGSRRKEWSLRQSRGVSPSAPGTTQRGRPR